MQVLRKPGQDSHAEDAVQFLQFGERFLEQSDPRLVAEAGLVVAAPECGQCQLSSVAALPRSRRRLSERLLGSGITGAPLHRAEFEQQLATRLVDGRSTPFERLQRELVVGGRFVIGHCGRR
jgi:hypothetical protein